MNQTGCMDQIGRNEVELMSTITCPACGSAKVETMPTNACQFFYDCTCCAALLRSKPGDCCVFCSYGSVPCPPVQASGKLSCCGDVLGGMERDGIAAAK